MVVGVRLTKPIEFNVMHKMMFTTRSIRLLFHGDFRIAVS